MNKRVLLCTVFGLIVEPAFATDQSALSSYKWDESRNGALDLTGYQLSWSDEFSANSLSASGGSGTWITGAPSAIYGVAKLERSYNPNVYSVSNGLLHIKATPEIINGVRTGYWNSGQVQTVDSLTGNGFGQQDGYFEARIKFPNEGGAWPAFWFKNKDFWTDRTKTAIEIDPAEWYGGDWGGMHHSVHLKPASQLQPGEISQAWYASNYAGQRNASGQSINMAADFHNYGLLLNATDIIVYLDRKELARFPRLEEFHTEVYPILSLGVWAADAAANSGPMDMQIDYVRVFAPGAVAPPPAAPPPVVQVPPSVPPPPPVAGTPPSNGTPSLTASSLTITQGQPLTLSWNAPNASSCTGIGTTLPGPTSGSFQFTPTQSDTYQVNCTGPSGTTAKNVSITVVPQSAAPGTPSLTASSLTITQGQPLTLSWNAPGATSCTGIGTYNPGPTSGSFQFTPTHSDTYQVNCTGPTGTTAKTVSITVVPQSSASMVLAESGSADPASATLAATSTDTAALTASTATNNQLAVAQALNSSRSTNGNWDSFLLDFASLPAAEQGDVLDQLSGAGLSGGGVVNTMLAFKTNDLLTQHAFNHAAGEDTVSNIVPVQLAMSQMGSSSDLMPNDHRLNAPDDDALRKIADEGGAWIEPIALRGTLKGGSSSGNLDYTVNGFLTGHDWRVNDNWTAGIATGWSEFTANNYALDTNEGGKTYNIALYTGYQRKNFFLLNTATASVTDLNTTRNLFGIGVGARSDSKVRGFAFSSAAGYGFDLGANTKFTTAASGLLTVRNQSAFSEIGAGDVSLNVEASTSTLFVGGMSGMVTHKTRFANTEITPEFGLGMAFAVGDRYGTTKAAFAGAPEDRFDVTGAEIPELVGTVHAGVSSSVGENTKLYVAFDGAGGSKTWNNFVSAGVRFRF